MIAAAIYCRVYDTWITRFLAAIVILMVIIRFYRGL
jgi:hypothetical protein